MGDYNSNPRKSVNKHPSCIEAGECRPPHRGGKNTRHWCKGRVGIPHTWEWLRRRWETDLETRYGCTFNRITEEPVCFGCTKVDNRRRSYCRCCGAPWPQVNHVDGHIEPCATCGAPWRTALIPARIGT